MSHRINIRLPDNIYENLCKKDGTITGHVCTALENYLCTNDVQKMYSIDQVYVKHLEIENSRLWNLYESLQDAVIVKSKLASEINVEYTKPVLIQNHSQKKISVSRPVSVNPKRNNNNNSINKNIINKKKKGFWSRFFKNTD